MVTFLYADDQVIVANKEDILQSCSWLNNVRMWPTVISVPKTKVMAFVGTEQVRSKIAINNQAIE